MARPDLLVPYRGTRDGTNAIICDDVGIVEADAVGSMLTPVVEKGRVSVSTMALPEYALPCTYRPAAKSESREIARNNRLSFWSCANPHAAVPPREADLPPAPGFFVRNKSGLVELDAEQTRVANFFRL